MQWKNWQEQKMDERLTKRLKGITWSDEQLKTQKKLQMLFYQHLDSSRDNFNGSNNGNYKMALNGNLKLFCETKWWIEVRKETLFFSISKWWESKSSSTFELKETRHL